MEIDHRDAEAGGDGPDPEVTPFEPEPVPVPEPARPTFLGEVVRRRSWPLIAIVFAFAVFLAAVPFLFITERSPFAEAVAAYDRLCASARAGDVVAFQGMLARPAAARGAIDAAHAMSALRCLDRTGAKTSFESLPGREYILTITPGTPDIAPVIARFVMEDEVLRYEP